LSLAPFPIRRVKGLIVPGTISTITPKTALRLSLIFDTTAFYWLALQARYDLERAKPAIRAYRPLVD
jgi:plasmid maintenance system antidote protein VapI